MPRERKRPHVVIEIDGLELNEEEADLIAQKLQDDPEAFARAFGLQGDKRQNARMKLEPEAS